MPIGTPSEKIDNAVPRVQEGNNRKGESGLEASKQLADTDTNSREGELREGLRLVR